MSVKVLIVEDEVLVAEDLASDLVAYGFEIMDTVVSAEDCLASLNANPPSIVLMDIKIKGDIDGIELAQRVVNDYQIPIIYLTANTDAFTVNRAVQTHPNAFITKPYNRNDLVVAIELAFQKYNSAALNEEKDADSIFVKSGNVYKKIPLDTILYVEASGSYSNIITEPGDRYTLSKNLLHVQRKVTHRDFVKVHRSFIVNIRKVDAFGHDSVILDKTEIPVSRQYQDSLKRFKRI